MISPKSDRLHTLDAVRGVAVMGILLMNIIAFALPTASYFNPVATGDASAADMWSWAIAYVLVDGKMRGLFSFLFGASMLLVVERARAAGRSGTLTHLSRMAVLFGFGAAHFVLIWYGDILNHYAVVGVIALAFVGLSARTLVKLSAGLFAISTLVFAMASLGIASMQAQASRSNATPALVADWRAFTDDFGVARPAVVAREVAIYRGDYAGRVADRIERHLPDTLQILVFGGAETLGLMLAGMAGLKSGFLTGGWSRRRYRRFALIAYAIGVPASALLGWLTWRSGFDAVIVFATGFVPSPLRVAVMLGHAALLMLLLKDAHGRLTVRLAAVGRAAFTNYLGTSVLMTGLFYGLGLFAALPRATLYLIPPLVWLLMLAWSKPWLDRFQYGPMEWLWRSLARWRLQPMRRLLEPQIRPNP